MAYLRPNTTIFMQNNGQAIYGIIENVTFRRYWGKRKDKNTGQMVRARKSMPFAVCSVSMSSDSDIPIGAKFLIPGYQLRNVTMKGEKILCFHDKYSAEFAQEYGNEWVKTLIAEEELKISKKSDQ
tara:strand:- start:111 stop:488 length:378 start_codon:yes stop_codon:yes gene_type:complete